MMNYIEYMEHIGMKLLSILSTAWGWAVGLVLLLVDFIAGHEMAVGLVVFVTLMDAVWGIAVSIKRKEDLAPGRFAYLSETRMNDLKAQGYEGTIDTTSGPMLGAGKDATEYTFFNPNSYRLADAVTYDNKGVRIPLGERDNFKINDIRYGSL